jgi:tetratricopeptide (TPR) repeat protein
MQKRREYLLGDARDHFVRALALDPSFATAHVALARVLSNLGNEKQSKHHMAEAERHIERMPERDRLLFLALRTRGADPRRSAELLEALIARHPDTEEGYSRLVNLYGTELYDRERLRDIVDRSVRAVPTAADLWNYRAYVLATVGTYDEAITALEEYQRLLPGSTNPIDSLAEVSLTCGRVHEALKLYEDISGTGRGNEFIGAAYGHAALGNYDSALESLRMFASGADKVAFRWPWRWFVEAFVLSRVGRYREAAARIATGTQNALELEAFGAEVAYALLQAFIGLERGRSSDVLIAGGQARKAATRIEGPARSRIAHEHALYLMGVAEARAGRVSSARELRAEMSALAVDPVPGWEHCRHRLDAEIALAQGDVDGAEACFAPMTDVKPPFSFGYIDTTLFMNNEPLRDWRARIAHRRGDARAALAEYRRLVTPHHDWTYAALLEPRYVLAMARIHDEMGDRGAAVAAAERFLGLWRNADAGSPEVAEARRIAGV